MPTKAPDIFLECAMIFSKIYECNRVKLLLFSNSAAFSSVASGNGNRQDSYKNCWFWKWETHQYISAR
jgi:hypothetical protein